MGRGGDGQVTLVRLPRRDGPPTYLLDSAFAGRDRLTLGTYDKGFADAWRSLGRELGAWERASGLWDPAGDRRRAQARALGVVAAVAGLLLTAQSAVWAARSGPGWLVLVAARRGHLREYTAWAVAVGELDRWSRAVAGSSTARADPAAARYSLLAPALVSGTSGSSARPSSSGSGGGAGGVGGGAGGGGGGSW